MSAKAVFDDPVSPTVLGRERRSYLGRLYIQSTVSELRRYQKRLVGGSLAMLPSTCSLMQDLI